MKTFHRLVANTLIANVTNNFLWFALMFWVYLETRSVMATAIIAGGYMLLLAVSGVFFGTFVDRNLRKTSMLLSTGGTLVAFVLAGVTYLVAPAGSLQDLGHPAFWALVALILTGAILGNLRSVALATTVTLLVPEDGRDKANGLVGTVNGVAFAITSVFSGLGVGLLGMGWCLVIAIVLTGLAGLHLMSIRVDEEPPERHADSPTVVDLPGALRAVRISVPGLMALLLFSTFNNFLGGVFMSLMDPYGLSLMSVEVWGVMLGITSLGFIIGGIVARRGLGANPVRTLLLVNVVLWTVTIVFPIRSAIVPLAVGFFIYMLLIPAAEASEQTIIQKVVPLPEQGRVFGFAQSFETAASPFTAFLIGPIAQLWVIPFMTDGAGADLIGSWFGTGPDRGMALIFIVAGCIGLLVTVLALRSRSYRLLSTRYAEGPDDGEEAPTGPRPDPRAVTEGQPS